MTDPPPPNEERRLRKDLMRRHKMIDNPSDLSSLGPERSEGLGDLGGLYTIFVGSIDGPP